MGAIAKKAIGIMATAAAATMVTMLIDKARVGSVGFSDTANIPARIRAAMAETSAMRKLINLVRRW